MTKRNIIYAIVTLNVLYVATLTVCRFFIGDLHPPDFAAMRHKIEASSSMDDLRPRTLHVISAIESADRVIGHLHEVATRLIASGITLAIVNVLVLCFVVLRTLRL